MCIRDRTYAATPPSVLQPLSAASQSSAATPPSVLQTLSTAPQTSAAQSSTATLQSSDAPSSYVAPQTSAALSSTATLQTSDAPSSHVAPSSHAASPSLAAISLPAATMPSAATLLPAPTSPSALQPSTAAVSSSITPQSSYQDTQIATPTPTLQLLTQTDTSISIPYRRHSSRLARPSNNNPPRRSSRLQHNYVTTHSATSIPTSTSEDSQSCSQFRLILDSGATAHMFNTISFFQNYRVSEQPSQHQVRIATGVQIPVLGFGTLPGKHSALYVPQLADNILSVSELDKSGFSTLFEQDTATVYQRNNKAILFLIHRDIDSGLYTVNQSQFEAAFQLTHRACLSHYCSNLNPLMRAHYIYGHPSAARTRYICKCLGLKVNLTSRALDCIRNCDICHQVKIKRQKVIKHIERNTILGKVWHHDIKGPFSTASLHYGHHYQSAYRESKSRYTVLYLSLIHI